MQRVFDGHNDVLLRLWENARKGQDPIKEFIDGTDIGHIDLPVRAKAVSPVEYAPSTYLRASISNWASRMPMATTKRHFQCRWNVVPPSTSLSKSPPSR